MDETRESVMSEAKRYLTEVGLELEASAAGARGAAEGLDDREAAWRNVQQMYARLAEAERLLAEFRARIDAAVAARR